VEESVDYSVMIGVDILMDREIFWSHVMEAAIKLYSCNPELNTLCHVEPM